MLGQPFLLEMSELVSRKLYWEDTVPDQTKRTGVRSFGQFLDSCEDKLEPVKIVLTNECLICLVNSFKKPDGLQKC